MDLMKMMKQAKEMQGKMQDLQAEFARLEVHGASAGGKVEITLTAQGDMRRIKIDPALLQPEEAETLEDLLMVAHADARAKGQAAIQDRTNAAMSGMGLPPGLKLPV